MKWLLNALSPILKSYLTPWRLRKHRGWGNQKNKSWMMGKEGVMCVRIKNSQELQSQDWACQHTFTDSRGVHRHLLLPRQLLVFAGSWSREISHRHWYSHWQVPRVLVDSFTLCSCSHPNSVIHKTITKMTRNLERDVQLEVGLTEMEGP